MEPGVIPQNVVVRAKGEGQGCRSFEAADQRGDHSDDRGARSTAGSNTVSERALLPEEQSHDNGAAWAAPLHNHSSGTAGKDNAILQAKSWEALVSSAVH